MSEFALRETTVVFARARWDDPADCLAVIDLLDAYARDPMGGGEPLGQYARANLPKAMATTPGAFSVIGRRKGEPVALANCFTALSTFACKPLINVHDLVVVADARGLGIGQQLLMYIEREASRMGCCKITLEVLTGNRPARRSYERFGFTPYTLDESTGHALFLQKQLCK
ncbi:MAG: GNAT family N-acetyltransferase [Granulosicoccus sp.]|nr:GNAT family N-acetyltransferase [Granulosicoccus sp.]